jgi:hypothetical protein
MLLLLTAETGFCEFTKPDLTHAFAFHSFSSLQAAVPLEFWKGMKGKEMNLYFVKSVFYFNLYLIALCSPT